MNDLIKISNSIIGDTAVQTVNARISMNFRYRKLVC